MKLKQRTEGGTWYVHFTGLGGQRVRLSTDTSSKDDASVKAHTVVAKYWLEAAGTKPVEGYTGDTLESMLRRAWEVLWNAPDVKKSNKYSNKKRMQKLIRLAGHWRRESITAAKVRDLLDGITTGKNNPKPIAAATKNRYVAMLSAAYTVAREANPSIAMPVWPHWEENNIKERYVSDDEEAAILKWYGDNIAKGDDLGAYSRDLFVVLIDSGMRCSEAMQEMGAASFRTLQGGKIGVHLKHGSTKNGKGRVVPLSARATQAALRMIASPYHGLNSKGEPNWTSQLAGQKFKRILKDCGIQGVTLHILRHTTASRLLQNGADIYKVMLWLGHSSIEVTKRYAHLQPNALVAEAHLLDGRADVQMPSSPEVHPLLTAQSLDDGTVGSFMEPLESSLSH